MASQNINSELGILKANGYLSRFMQWSQTILNGVYSRGTYFINSFKHFFNQLLQELNHIPTVSLINMNSFKRGETPIVISTFPVPNSILRRHKMRKNESVPLKVFPA